MKIYSEHHLTASSERAWHVLGENFAKIAQWASSLESSSLDGELGLGANRTCRIKSFGPIRATTIIEELLDFDAQAMQFTYHVKSGLPPFLSCAQNKWSIQSTGEDHCKVNSEALVKLKWWFWPLQWVFMLLIKRDMNKTFEEMRYFIENDKVHPRKLKSHKEP